MLALVLLLVTAIYNYPKLNIISGYAAKNMASSIFVAERKPESIINNDNNVPLIKLAEAEVNAGENSVSASVFGLMNREAVFREGLGCVLVNEDYDPAASFSVPKRTVTTNELAFPYGDATVKDSTFAKIDYKLLKKAIDSAFARPEIQKTRSVLIVYKDHIIAERYASGFTRETPILGWSMTKSVWATLFGILEYQNKIAVDSFKPFLTQDNGNEDAKDSKANITLNHLLRMQSGLEWNEDYTRISDVTKMLFLDTDMTLAQGNKDVIAPPTEIWNYSSGTTNYLSGVLRKKFDNQQQYLDFPYLELIDKIGMNSMLLEADMSGNYVGSSYGWANTRDWAKFGLLYLHKGQWNGTQIFAPEWVNYVTTPTAHSNGTYGAHFWLNAGGKYPGVPKDLFSANGYQGQYVFIIPSKDLVIVRTGLAEAPEFNLNGFLKAVVDAVE